MPSWSGLAGPTPARQTAGTASSALEVKRHRCRCKNQRVIRRALAIVLWRLLALCALALGVAGVILPGIPGVPFLLVAAWAGSRGWPAFERWLLAHPRLGPPVRAWRDHGAVPRQAKWWASGMMTLAALMLWLLPMPLWLRVGAPLAMLAVGTWLWRRPER